MIRYKSKRYRDKGDFEIMVTISSVHMKVLHTHTHTHTNICITTERVQQGRIVPQNSRYIKPSLRRDS